jgi:transposase
MKFVSALTSTDREALTRLHSEGPTHRQRQRAQAVLLSAKGYTLEQIADVLDTTRIAVSDWLDRRQKQGLAGLADAPKSGRRRKIDASLGAILRDLLIENPSPNMKALLQAEIKKRQASLLGHRKALPQAAGLYLPPGAARACEGRLPQKAGPRQAGLVAPAPPGRRGPLRCPLRRRERVLLVAAGTASFVIESIEALLPLLSRPTVLVLDNATVHRSKAVQAKRKEWKQKGLRLLFLPPYCPHLNKIEILWRQVKYQWLWPAAYADFPTLCQSVTDILAQVGTKYRVSFA